MNRFIEASGKTVKDAIQNGLKELGMTLDQVETSVIEMGSPGLFGMFGKPAKVRLTVKEDDSFNIEMPTFTLDGGKKQRGEKTREAKQEAPAKAEKLVEKVEKAEAAEAVEETAAAEEAPKAEKKERKPRNRRERKENKEPKAEPVTEAAPVEPEAPFEATAEEELSDTAKKARDFLKGLTERMGVPAEIEVGETEEQLRMLLSGENMSILIGRRGETLDALQYLAGLAANRGEGDYMRIVIDSGNYRDKRRGTLEQLAKKLANTVIKTGRSTTLEPKIGRAHV